MAWIGEVKRYAEGVPSEKIHSVTYECRVIVTFEYSGQNLYRTISIFPLPAYLACSGPVDLRVPKLMPAASIRLKELPAGTA
jgi:hypothetical protein